MKDVSIMDLICKYVIHNGKKVGESLDVFEGYLILKNETTFVGVPLVNITSVDGEDILISEYDEKKGIERGEMWREKKSKPVSLEDLALGE